MELSERTCISEGEISDAISQVNMQISNAPFIATVNAVTSRQELRWIIEPVMPSESLELSREHTAAERGGFRKNSQLTPDEEEKRRRRRERNKMAAAKCRNRRRELIDLLQEETERLHMEQVVLQKQVSCLQQEKEQLKMLLASHASICTLAQDKPRSLDTFRPREILPSRISLTIKQEPLDDVVAEAAGRGVTVTDGTQFNNWKWENAVIFAATVITTIGYGNVAPKTTGGRLFCILYGLCGIPLCLTWISELGTFFGGRAKRLSQVLLHKGLSVKKIQFICTIVFLLWGFLIHLIIPAYVFTFFENWTYLEGLYFSFTTLTTVGFGDYVAGVDPKGNYPNLYRFLVQLWTCLGLAWLSLFFSWNVHMVVEAHKVLKKRRLRRHRLPIDDLPEEKEVKKTPKPPPRGVVNIFGFMSEKVEDYSDVIRAIGADERRKKKTQEDELTRSKSCSDLLQGLVIPLDHSPRLKRRFSVSGNMCMSGESTDGLNNNNNSKQEEQTLLKMHHRDPKERKTARKGTKRAEKPGHCAWDSRKSDPSVFQSPLQSPTVTTSNRGSRFSVSKVSEDYLLGKRKSIG